MWPLHGMERPPCRVQATAPATPRSGQGRRPLAGTYLVCEVTKDSYASIRGTDRNASTERCVRCAGGAHEIGGMWSAPCELQVQRRGSWPSGVVSGAAAAGRTPAGRWRGARGTGSPTARPFPRHPRPGPVTRPCPRDGPELARGSEAPLRGGCGGGATGPAELCGEAAGFPRCGAVGVRGDLALGGDQPCDPLRASRSLPPIAVSASRQPMPSWPARASRRWAWFRPEASLPSGLRCGSPAAARHPIQPALFPAAARAGRGIPPGNPALEIHVARAAGDAVHGGWRAFRRVRGAPVETDQLGGGRGGRWPAVRWR